MATTIGDDNNFKWGILGRIVDRLLKEPLWKTLIIYPFWVLLWGYLGIIVWQGVNGKTTALDWTRDQIVSLKQIDESEQMRMSLERKKRAEQDFLEPLLENTNADRVGLWDIHDGVELTSLNQDAYFAHLVAEAWRDGYGTTPTVKMLLEGIRGYQSLLQGECVMSDVSRDGIFRINKIGLAFMCPIFQDKELDGMILLGYDDVEEFNHEEVNLIFLNILSTLDALCVEFGDIIKDKSECSVTSRFEEFQRIENTKNIEWEQELE